MYYLKPPIFVSIISTSPDVHSNYNNDMYALLCTNGNTVNDKTLQFCVKMFEIHNNTTTSYVLAKTIK